jgi:hypothetical protein
MSNEKPKLLASHAGYMRPVEIRVRINVKKINDGEK